MKELCLLCRLQQLKLDICPIYLSHPLYGVRNSFFAACFFMEPNGDLPPKLGTMPPLNLAVVVSIMPSDLDLSSRLLDSQMHEIPQLICIPLHLHVCINYNYQEYIILCVNVCVYANTLYTNSEEVKERIFLFSPVQIFYREIYTQSVTGTRFVFKTIACVIW